MVLLERLQIQGEDARLRALPVISPESGLRRPFAEPHFVTFFPIVILAVVQGIAEFLPISASGHRVLATSLLGWPAHSSVIAVAIHAGTLLAVLAYFWRDIWEMLTGGVGVFAGRKGPGFRLLLFVVIATIPIVAASYVGMRYLGAPPRSVETVAWTTLGFGLLLGIADRLCMTVRRIEHMNYAGAVFVGAAQVMSLFPGTSRAGITMTACRLLGMERREAARFSILLSIPAILGAAGMAAADAHRAGDISIGADAVLAAALAFAAALGAIAVMMRWLTHATFTPFVVYRVVLGAGLLYWLYS
jgi:undecaprenyl-diphosphatase